jgi:hypothetical protein
MTWLSVNYLMLLFFVVAMARVGTRPAERGLLPGLGLMAVAVAVILLRELSVIPRRFWVEARTVEVGVAVLGLVLIVRKYSGMPGVRRKR